MPSIRRLTLRRSVMTTTVFYATDDDCAGEEVERLIRAAGFEPAKIGGIQRSGRPDVGGDLHNLVLGPAQPRALMGRI
jgi:8-hydroxy-5-deazaflavin:NADPH oxidoreductase